MPKSHSTRLAMAPALVLTFGVCPCGGDEIVVKGMPYVGVTILNATESWVMFMSTDESALRTPLTDISRIVLKGAGDFNEAEQLLLAGETDRAVAAYKKALAKAPKGWRRLLVRSRLATAELRGGHARLLTDSAKRHPRPPSVLTEVARGRGFAAGEGPETLLARIRSSRPVPPDLGGLTPVQRGPLQKKYAEALRGWREKARSKKWKVAWGLTVSDVRRSPVTRNLVLQGVSRDGYTVRAFFPAASSPRLRRLRVGHRVTIAGEVEGIPVDRPLPREIELKNCALVGKKRARRLPKAALGALIDLGGAVETERKTPPRFFGVPLGAERVVYVVDRSGSMVDTFHFVVKALAASLGSLAPDQSFHVIFFSSGPPMETPPKGLVLASPANKIAAVQFMAKVLPRGQSDPIPALKRAFEVLRTENPRKGKKLIVFLTDGDFPNNKEVLETIAKRNAKKDVHINTYLYEYRGKQAMAVMQKIAKDSGGRFKYVSGDE